MLDWFTTIPGILIICGVILLVIAIILFIAGSKKSKKESLVTNSTVTNTEPVVSNNNNMVSDNGTMVAPSMEGVVDAINPTQTLDTTSIPATDNEPVIENSETAHTTLEDSIPVQEIEQGPNTSNFIISEPAVQEAESSSVYDSVTPVINFDVPEEKPVTIYGGNDPLEATQVLPKMEEHREPYSGSYPEARIVDSNISMDIPTPVEEVITAMPTVESTIESPFQPAVIEIPDTESVSEPISIDSFANNINISEEPSVEVKNTVEEL